MIVSDKALYKAQKARRIIQYDAKLLANRIAMLQNEENRLMKKITDTRTRADQILILKQKNDAKFNEKVVKK